MVITRVYNYSLKLLASRWFFFVIVMLFAVQAAQLALTSAYPMAFDESYHVGVTQFFSGYWQPFVSSQSPDTYVHGAIAHNPSFLYHFLLSFPYRVVAAFTDNVAVQVVVLRLVNVGLAVGTLFVLRRLFVQLHVMPHLSNLVLFVVALTPMFSALSAQVNYDNAIVLLTAVVGYYLVKLLTAEQLHARTFMLLLAMSLLGCLVKFSFLPVLLGVFLCVGIVFVRRARRCGSGELFGQLQNTAKTLGRKQLLALGALGTVSVGLFVSFYGYALVRYHNPVPQCNQILSVEACTHYYAWNRNFLAAQNKTDAPLMNPAEYTLLWVRAVYYHLFAELIPTGGIVGVAKPFYVAVMALTAAAALCVLVRIRDIFARYPALKLLSLVTVVYLLFLWGRNYSEYVRLGEWVAVQGRYIVPVMPVVYLLLVLGVRSWLQSSGRRVARHVAAGATVLILALFVHFGGNASYLSNITPWHNWQSYGPSLNMPVSTLVRPYSSVLLSAGITGAAYIWRGSKRRRRQRAYEVDAAS